MTDVPVPCPNCQTSRMPTALGACEFCGATLTPPRTGHWPPPLSAGTDLKPVLPVFNPAVEQVFPVDFGDYRLLDKLGQGGMGTVYLGEHRHLGRRDAIKILSRENAHKPGFVERFLREMRAAGALRHPHIVQSYSAGESGGHYFLAMECLQGEDLEALLKRRGPLPVQEACRLVQQAAEALHFAHTAGLVHRDVKPSNLFFTTDNQVKLLDLGLARPLLESQADVAQLTEANAAMGTPDYMAPEQWTDARVVDGRVDVYALGCTLFTLIAGSSPYADYKSWGSKLLAHQSRPVPDLCAVRENIPPALARLITRCLAKRREDRPATAQEVADALAPFVSPNPSPHVSQASVPVRLQPYLPMAGALVISACLILGALFWREYGRVPLSPVPVPAPSASSPTPAPTTAKAETIVAPHNAVASKPAEKAATPQTLLAPIGSNDPPSVEQPKAMPATTPQPPMKARPVELPVDLPPTRVSPSTALEMVLIPTGTFTMGVPVTESAARAEEQPAHQVQLSRPFYLGVYEVTQDEYEKVMGANPSHFAMAGSRFPVEQVSWFDAVEFCNALSFRDKLPEHYTVAEVRRKDGRIIAATVSVKNAGGYRLPTEAEWEYACRAGTLTSYFFGDSANGTNSNVDGTAPYGTAEAGPNHKRTVPVGTHPKNAFGLADAHGNVWEWCEDVYDPAAYMSRQSQPAIDPLVTSGSTFRVIRGGGWINNAHSSRAAARLRSLPENFNSYFGFRVALSPL